MKNVGTLTKSIVRSISKKIDPISTARKAGVTIGDNCRLINVNFGSEPYLVTLGDHVSATNTEFITHDGGVWVFRNRDPSIDVIQPILVGNNVFFGSGSIIMPGVIIGNNVVIGAGSVVTGNISSNIVAAGVPAKPIKSIKEYWESCSKKQVPTKQLSPSEKKKYLQRKFGSIKNSD